jgi:hypothetical protein
MRFPKEALREAIYQDSSWTLEGLKLEHCSGWYGGHKGEDVTYVISYEGKYYAIEDHRSGSGYSEWHYDSSDWRNEVECDEVEKIPVTIFKWVRVKNK